MWSTERKLRVQGYERIAGVDEAGRGPLAGPVVAAAVVLPGISDRSYRTARRALAGLDDSKKLTPAVRAKLAEKIVRHAIAWGIGEAGVAEIDRVNILNASFLAMRTALANMAIAFPPGVVDLVIVDGHLPIREVTLPQRAIIGGDARCAAIAAASILAKVHRDKVMDALHREHPAYGFDRHKGYPTPEHREILARLGPCPAHRQSYRPVQEAAAARPVPAEPEAGSNPHTC